MNIYRVSNEEVAEQQADYRKRYKPFRRFLPDERAVKELGFKFCSLVTVQDGQDTDDYCIADNNKVEMYLSFVPAGSKVLLLGTGSGREVKVALSMGMDAYGTTLGSRNLDFAVDELKIDQHRMHECLNESLPFARESFDCIAGFQVFEHAIAPLIFLLEQGRLLKPGGTLFLEWPPPDNFSMGDNPHHQVCFTPGQAEALFQKAGFTNIELRYADKELSLMPEDKKWNGVHDKMLLIKGVKKNPSQVAEYIRRFWA